MAKVLAFSNQKGGVGKTTTCGHVGRAAVLAGLKVLFVDADPQGNLTSSLQPADFSEETPGLADALSIASDLTLTDVIVDTPWEGADMVSTVGSLLAGVRKEISTGPVGREFRLREALEPVLGRYDLILIDCPPSLDDLTFNAYTAAHGIVVVAEADMYSANGIAQLLEAVTNLKKYTNPQLEVTGVVINGYRKGTSEAEHWRRVIVNAVEALQLRILEPTIPLRLVIQASFSSGRGLDQMTDNKSIAKEMGKKYDTLLKQLVA